MNNDLFVKYLNKKFDRDQEIKVKFKEPFFKEDIDLKEEVTEKNVFFCGASYHTSDGRYFITLTFPDKNNNPKYMIPFFGNIEIISNTDGTNKVVIDRLERICILVCGLYSKQREHSRNL